MKDAKFIKSQAEIIVTQEQAKLTIIWMI